MSLNASNPFCELGLPETVMELLPQEQLEKLRRAFGEVRRSFIQADPNNYYVGQKYRGKVLEMREYV
ncbi:hypothetical protein H9L39_16539 [Fusarium oxysporum f. sp. albedinis]|nr:hypothetical protein H9L39_16539 [Fusarium oxysporum f. sp. albedinis]